MHLTIHHWRHYCQLIRLEKPIGTWLVLWPGLWSLWLASGGQPCIKYVIIFTAGAFIMRSAGCIINDYADRHLDTLVKRTRNRPLATGIISEKEALELFVIFMFAALMLVLMTNGTVIFLAFIGAVSAGVYPFMKRFTHLPQAMLGLAFSYPVPMAWAAETHHVPLAAWSLFIGNFFWIMAYDTYYAMVDRKDDIKAGIKSSAVLFASYDKLIIAFLKLAALFFFWLTGRILHLNGFYHLSLAVIAGLFIYQQYITRERKREACFSAFLNNNWVGAVLFMGILAGLST